MARKITVPRGFTLAEILLALGLIVVVVLALLGLSIRSLQVNSRNLDTVAGQLVADQALERVAYAAEQSTAAPVWSSNSVTVPFSNSQVSMGATSFNVTIYASDALSVPGKRLKRLTSRVMWADIPQGKSGSGILKVEGTRLVHEP